MESKTRREWQRSIVRSGQWRKGVREAKEMKSWLLICSLTGELELISEKVCDGVPVAVMSGSVCTSIKARSVLAYTCMNFVVYVCVCVDVFMHIREKEYQGDRLKQADKTTRSARLCQTLLKKGQIFPIGYYCWVTCYLIGFHKLKLQGQTFLTLAELNFLPSTGRKRPWSAFQPICQNLILSFDRFVKPTYKAVCMSILHKDHIHHHESLQTPLSFAGFDIF